MGDDAVVILDEGLLVIEVIGFLPGIDLDGVVDEGGDGGGIVLGDGLLEIVRS